MGCEETNRARKEVFWGALLSLPWRSILGRSCLIVIISSSVGLLRNWVAMPSVPWIYERPVQVKFSPGDGQTSVEKPAGTNVEKKEVLIGLNLEDAFEEFNFGIAFVDARETEEFMKGHIRNAISLPVALAEQELPSELANLNRSERVIVYCDESVCDSSEELGLLLKKRYGFEDVCVFRGGWEAWLNAGYPQEGLRGGSSS